MRGRFSGSRSTAGVVMVMLMLVAGRSPAVAQVSLTYEPTRDAIFSGLANNIGTLPNPTGGGFTYAFDPGLGVFTRSSESFGPVFANRAETTGRGRVTLNASFSRHTFDKVDGKDLRNGDFPDDPLGVFAVPVTLPNGAPGTLLEFVTLRTEVRADVYTIGGLYGVTDRIDVGITIPVLNVRIKDRPREQFFAVCDRQLTVCGNPQPSGVDFRPNTVESTGIGDLVLRGKWNFLQMPKFMGGRMGMAFAIDVKVPTGDEGDRETFTSTDKVLQQVDFTLADISGQQFPVGDPPLGTGIVRVRPQIVASGSWAGFAPHVNVGAELGETTGITNDLVYEVGFDYTFFQRATLSMDLLGRHAFNVDRVRVRNVIDQDFGKKANPDTLTLSVGLKVNPIGTLLVFVNVLFPLNQTGVRDDLTPTFGLEWSF